MYKLLLFGYIKTVHSAQEDIIKYFVFRGPGPPWTLV